MRVPRVLLFWLVPLALFALPREGRAAELVMYEALGCVYCARWHAEIGPAYPRTAEGRFAPLRQIFSHDPLPGDLTLTGRLVFTPTFVLVEDGRELARLEGYPGADFFWPLLSRMLNQHTDFEEEPQ